MAGIGCGRVDFTPVPDASGAISRVGGFVATTRFTSSSDQFTAQAQRAGDAIVLHVHCQVATPTAVSVSAPGWTIIQVGPLTGIANQRWVASFGAFAPDVASATFTVDWGTTCANLTVLGDEFAGVAAGPNAFDGHVEHIGAGDCASTLTTNGAGDAIWAACSSGGTLSGISAGYAKGVDDGHDDWSAYRVSADPANSTESVTFTNSMTSGVAYGITMIALVPAP
jgi:hypothetical protein